MSIEGLIRIEQFRQADFPSLVEAAKADNHGVFNPTDVIWKNNERVGYLSIGVLPTVMCWLSTKAFSARDTVSVFNTMEGIIRRSAPGLYFPAPRTSPVHPYLEKLGYVNGGNYDFFHKGF